MGAYHEMAIIILVCCRLIRSVERGFVYCPAYPCTCGSVDGELIINCRNLYLSSLPKFLSFEGRIKEISLRHNSIQNLPAYGFQGLHIEKLDLRDNAVTFIHKDAFAGLENDLRSLSIQLYAMYGLPTLSLSRLSHLTSLTIIGCQQRELRSDLFVNLTSLEQLHLIGCRIAHIHPSALTPLSQLNTLVLAQNALQSKHLAEINLMDDLIYLDLSSNDIRHLSSLAFSGFSKLRSLKIGSNKLTHIAKQSFYNLEFTLEDLDLKDNYINDKALHSIAGLRLLQRLDLSQNNILNISSEYFDRMRHLKCLNIANNNIRAIEKITFKGLGLYMLELDMHGNPLELIEPGTFSEFRALERLNLSATKLGETLRLDTFDGLTSSLKFLDVSKSFIVSEDLHSFSRLTNVTDLDLSGNKITEVNYKVMKFWGRLKYANFSHNHISTFMTGDLSASGLPLKTLDLSWNSIQTAQNCLFFVFLELTDVRLEGNPLACNCSLSWLYRWLQIQRSSHNQANYKWTCASPLSLKDFPFSDLEFADFKCPNSSIHGEKCLAIYDTPWTSGSWTATSIFHMHSKPSCDPICLNVSRPHVTSVFVEWFVEDNRDLFAFNIVLKRRNDSLALQSTIVPLGTVNYTFTFDNTIDLIICFSTLTNELVQLAQKCQTVPSNVAEEDLTSRKMRLGNLIHNSFLPLLFIYISGSLSVAFLIACIVVCVQRKRKKPRRVKPFYLTYPAWYDNRSSVSSSSLIHDVHVLKPSRFHTQSTLLADTFGMNAYDPDVSIPKDLPYRVSSRRESRLCNRDHNCACSTVNSVASSLGIESITGRSEVDNEFFFHF